MKTPTDLERQILQTSIYFDLMDYPLTDWEIWKWLYQDQISHNGRFNYFQVKDALENSEYLSQKLQNEEAFYFLAGRQELVRLRKNRYLIAWKKFRKLRRLTRLFKMIPFIKMIAVCNDLAYFNAPENSDFDFFIITQRRRIWLSRFLAVLITKILNLRPSEKNKKDKACLSVFVSEEDLELQKYKMSSEDVHYVYWLEGLVPIYDAGGYYQKLRQSNKWILNYLPNVFPFKLNSDQKIIETKLIKNIKKIKKYLTTDWDEKFYRWLQLKKLPSKIKSLMNHDTRVVVSDTILKFHTNDNRQEISDQFKKNCQQIIT